MADVAVLSPDSGIPAPARLRLPFFRCSTAERTEEKDVECTRGKTSAEIVDVWHSRDAFQKMMDNPEFQKNLEAAGWPTEPQLVEVYEVHASIHYSIHYSYSCFLQKHAKFAASK